MKKKVTLTSLRQEIKKLKARLRIYGRRIKQYEKEEEIVNKMIDIVEDAIIALPPLKVPKFKGDTKSKSEEVALLTISDVHVGKRTASYNPNVFIKRLKKLREGMLSIVTVHRSRRPIKKLVIVFNGDVIDAESIYPSQAIDHIAVPLIEQIFTYAVPQFTEFLYFCLENFEEVEVYGNKGNHGRLNAAKWSSSKSTNWEFVFLKTLEGLTKNQPRLKWNINTKDWKSLFRIQGHGFLATHGDMIRMYYSTPFYGFSRQSMRWQNAYQNKIKLSYFLFGHFHSAGAYRFNNVVIIPNGSFITDDPFAEEYLGVASIPEQMIMGVHKKYGVTWRYPIRLN